MKIICGGFSDRSEQVLKQYNAEIKYVDMVDWDYWEISINNDLIGNLLIEPSYCIVYLKNSDDSVTLQGRCTISSFFKIRKRDGSTVFLDC